jgi:shikimate kinase
MIEIDERKSWDRSRNVVLIGPGGAGKSSLGIALAPLLNHCLVDLDGEFSRRIGDIGEFLREEGYEAYKLRNSILAEQLMFERAAPTLLVTSSGFLAVDNPMKTLEANRRLVANCYSICLLPSRDLEKAVDVIVKRQSRRPFAGDHAHEERTIRARYSAYVQEGDLLVFSTAPSIDTAEAIARHLSGKS